MPRKKRIRRVPGTGSVYRRSDWAKRRKPWSAEMCYGLKPDGVRDRVHIGDYATEAEATDALDLYRLTHGAGDKEIREKVTYVQVWNQVLIEREKDGKTTNRDYRSAWRNHLKSSLGKKPIADGNTALLKQVIRRPKLSVGSQQRLLTILHWLYAYAMEHDIVAKDYSRYVKLDSRPVSTLHRPFTGDEMRLLWQHADLDIVKVVLIECYTGTRPTELATIEPANVHITDRYMIGGMKTAAGRNRKIPIADCILPFVQYFYAQAMFVRSKYLLVPNVAKYMYRKNGHVDIYRLYTDFLSKQTGITDHRPHDARHTFVSLADNYSVNDTIQKLIVGHARSVQNVTKDVYTHKVVSQLIRAVNTLPWGPKMRMYPEEEIQPSGRQVAGTN